MRVEGYTDDENRALEILPLHQLRKMPGATVCEGMVVETEKNINPHKIGTELGCIMCGRTFIFNTKKYLKVLDALGIDYSRRLP